MTLLTSLHAGLWLDSQYLRLRCENTSRCAAPIDVGHGRAQTASLAQAPGFAPDSQEVPP